MSSAKRRALHLGLSMFKLYTNAGINIFHTGAGMLQQAIACAGRVD